MVVNRTESAAPATLRRPATEAEAKALASPLRIRILRVCLGEPKTNKQIAAALDKDPATILHHVRTLVDTGFLAPQPLRRGTRGSREKPYVATGKSWRVNTPSTSAVSLDTFLEEVQLVPVEQLNTARLGLRLNASRLEAFEKRLQELFDEYELEPDDADGDAWSVFFAMHPDPNRPS